MNKERKSIFLEKKLNWLTSYMCQMKTKVKIFQKYDMIKFAPKLLHKSRQMYYWRCGSKQNASNSVSIRQTKNWTIKSGLKNRTNHSVLGTSTVRLFEPRLYLTIFSNNPMPANQHSTYPFQYGGVTYGLLAGVHTPTDRHGALV